jgi:hypothetical protein
MDDTINFNDFAKKHGAKKEVWDEDLKFQYQLKSMREYSASIFGSQYLEFPVSAFTSEAVYLQWCVGVSGVMPNKRGREFHKYIQERLEQAVEEEIPPGLEEGAIIKETILSRIRFKLYGGVHDEKEAKEKGLTRSLKDADDPEQLKHLSDREYMWVETREDTGFGEKAVFLRIEPLMDGITELTRNGLMEEKLSRKSIVKWLKVNGKHYNRESSPNRVKSVYALPLSFVWRD